MTTSDVVVAPAALPEQAVPPRVVKLSWGALFGGMFAALGVWLLLTVLGLAIGLSAIDPSRPASTKIAGLTTGIASLIVPLVALFVGGLVAARAAGIVDRATGAIHGAVMWSLATILGVVLTGAVLRGVIDTAGGVAGAAASALGSAGPRFAHGVGIDTSDLVGPINERLLSEGKLPIRPERLQAAIRDSAGMAMQDGQFDKDTFARALSDETGLSEAGASDIADRIEAQVRMQVDEMRRGALQAADATGHAMWWVFLGMTLSLASAVLGATIGVSRKQRMAARGVPIAVVEPQPVHP